MRRPKMFGLPLGLLLLALLGASSAQGTFEDAETSNDYTSGITHQQFDLRHTIPGEPEVDYPIYSEVPKTNFDCAGKHEGYYADMETRCQVFRICAHTARGTQGFGFLCPNGTLFSQKNFVCDWYRNVNCAESEQYYNRNSANRIGSSTDMLDKVRQMMEYPMKTISRALQNKPASHHTLKKQLELSESGVVGSEGGDEEPQSSRDSSQRAYLNRKQAVTRAQVESVSKTQVDSQQSTQVVATVTQQRKKLQQQRQQQRTETKTTKIKDEDVYVNSLGELSSDPGVNFAHDSARIIAESPSRTYNYEKKSNFAEKVNVGLNSLADTTAGEVFAPDYVKHLNTADKDVILAANINNLLEEVSTDDVDSSVSGYQLPAPQKNKTSFRFLSRGFSSQSDRSKRPSYEYAKPKQTASTIRFSPNELPIDDTYKDTKESIKQNSKSNDDNGATFESSDETMKFIIMTTTPTPIQPVEITKDTLIQPAEITKDTAAEIAAKIVADIIEPGVGFSSAHESETTEGPVAITTTAASTLVNSDRYYLNNVGTMPHNSDYNFLSPPVSESESDIEATTADEPTLYEFNDFDGGASPAQEIADVTPNAAETLGDSTQTETTTASAAATSAPDTSGADGVYANIVEKLLFPAQEETTATSSTTTTPAAVETDAPTYPPILDEEQLIAENQAAKLLLAGVKLTKHSNNQIDEDAKKARGSYSAILDPTYGEAGALFIHVEDDDQIADNTKTTTTTTTTTAQPETSTSIIASLSEGGSFQERIRNYRRFASHQRGSNKASTHGKRNQVAATGKLTTTTTKAPSSSSTTTTRSYLKRVAASRLRLSRLSAANNRLTTGTPSTTTDAATVEYSNTNNNSIELSQTSRKIAVRNIDKELGSIGGAKRYDARGNSFDRDNAGKRGTTSSPAVADESSTSSTSLNWETVRNNLRRFQVSHKPTTVATTTATPRRAVTKVTRNNAVRARNRFANFKTQQTSAAPTTTTTVETTTTTTTKTTTVPPTTIVEALTTVAPNTYSLSPTPNLDHILKSITSSAVSYSTTASANEQAPLSIAEPPTVFGLVAHAPQTYQTFDLTAPSATAFASTSTPVAAYEFPSITTASSSSSSPLSFDTHADDSATFLDFDKLTRAIADDSVLQNFRAQQQFSRPPTVYQTAPVNVARSLFANTNARAVDTSVTPSYNKLPPQAPAQLTSTQRSQQQQHQFTQIVQQHTPPTSPAPRIVIARAEGQRIAPNSVSSIISALATQPPPKTTPPTSYVALDDFLTKKFGPTAPGNTKTNAEAKQAISYGNQQSQQQQQYKPAQSPPQSYYQKAPTTSAQQIQPLYNRAAAQESQLQKQQQAQQSQQQQQQFQQQIQQQQQQQLQQQYQQLQQLHQFQQQQQKLQQQQLQQQQLKQQQQYAQQQLKEQQYFQQFVKPANAKVNAQQQQQQPQQQPLWQQKQQQQTQQQPLWQQKQQQSAYSQQPAPQQQQTQQYQQQKQTYLQPTQTQQQQVNYQKQQQQQQQQQQVNYQKQQQQQQQNTRPSSFTQQQQQSQQQTTSNFFTNFQQQPQQQQFPQFPPFTSNSAAATQSHQLSFDELTNSIVPPEHDKHLNIQLPALTAGLIPAPKTTTFTAQRRMDVVDAAESETSSVFHDPGVSSSAYNGVSSYDVPLSSIGRLPNDITHLLRRLRKVK